MNEQQTEKNHALALDNRERMTLSGVTEVVSFDDEGVLLKTVMGTLAIDGRGMTVARLDLERGQVDLTGKVNGLFYADTGAKKGLFRRR